jgi:hypothetical protein
MVAGWTTLRIWKHEPPGTAVDRVVATLQLLRDEA